MPVDRRLPDAVLFDLGNTLVQYYSRAEFPALLEESIGQVQRCLAKHSLPVIPSELLWPRVRAEDCESADHRVRPMEERLARIFLPDAAQPHPLMPQMCRAFMEPIFGRSRPYADTLPTLRALGSLGIRLAIVSNTAWGSPASLWREELHRFGLDALVEMSFFCRDVGWRKPAPQVFEHALHRLGASAERCLFVGDDPRWDLAGARAVGMKALLIRRSGEQSEDQALRNLDELMVQLQSEYHEP